MPKTFLPFTFSSTKSLHGTCPGKSYPGKKEKSSLFLPYHFLVPTSFFSLLLHSLSAVLAKMAVRKEQKEYHDSSILEDMCQLSQI